MEKKGRVSDYRFDRKRTRRSSNNGTAIAGGAQANQYQVHVKIPPLRNEPYYSHRKIVAGIVDQTISLYYNFFFFSSGLTMREGESMEERCSMSGAWPIIAFVQSTLNVRRGRS